jgi:tRNA-2-methylthio-N6-dimethylallyladenosine synthase
LPRRFFVKSYGCQMNVYDTARMGDLLRSDGHVETFEQAEADVVILNTCHIREKATEKLFSELGRARDMKTTRAAEGGDMQIVVAGCVAQAEGAEIIARQPAVDFVVGPQAYHRLPSLIAKGKQGTIALDLAAQEKFEALPLPRQDGAVRRGPSAFVTVQEGCDRFCTFCVVPYTRGVELSRPVAAVVAEVENLVWAGVKEVSLIGQNVNAYHGKGPHGQSWSLGRLIDRLAQMPALRRLRYTTSHPCDMDDELIEAHRDVRELMPYLHLPAQSGSDRVLSSMNRRHTARDYLRIIEKARRARSDIAVSSDFIVGFPGETQADFEATLELVREVGFAASFSFKYSARPGTPSFERKDQIAEEVKGERLAILQELLEEQRQAFNRACIGRTLEVLFDKSGRYEGQLAGKSPYLQAVHASRGDAGVGDIRSVIIEAAAPNSLAGRVHAKGAA